MTAKGAPQAWQRGGAAPREVLQRGDIGEHLGHRAMNEHADFGLDHGRAPRRYVLDPQAATGCVPSLEVLKPFRTDGDILDHLDLDTKPQILQALHQLLAVHEVNRWGAVPGRF